MGDDWPEFADQLFAHLDDHNEAPPWLILIDELPVFVAALQERGGAAAIREFLYWLRGMRQKHRRIRWLYTGSIGLDTIARRNQVEGALNDLDPFTLGPFDPETARDFIADVARRRGCTCCASGGCGTWCFEPWAIYWVLPSTTRPS
ncbi:hypothetical protein [uncultured Thiodictyon sp.]|uniref:hypothetical protein n=1 Tax=uncultured Thiodictyon sp. TaxID=1846217 RepID=UPI0025DC5763|nr:hypothetical protein [uncultured Thiodictyon sp.]